MNPLERKYRRQLMLAWHQYCREYLDAVRWLNEPGRDGRESFDAANLQARQRYDKRVAKIKEDYQKAKQGKVQIDLKKPT